METYLPTLTVAGVLAFLAPLVSTAVYKLTASPKVKQLIALLVALALAVVAMMVTGGFTSHKPDEDPVVYWTMTALSVIAVSQVAYGLVWKNSAVDAKVATITSSDTERARYIDQNTIRGEVIPEDAQPVPDALLNPSRTTDGPDHRTNPPVG